MPVIYANIEKSIEDLLEMRRRKTLRVPRHQRGYCWDDMRKHQFIYSIQDGLPIPCVCLYEDEKRCLWIEDGQQRLTTIELFHENKFSVPGIGYFRDLTELQQHQFLHYKVPVLEFKKATPKERITIFDRFQNGLSLTTGERYNSLRMISPTVEFAVDTFLVPGNGVHARAVPVWGKRLIEDGEDDKDVEESRGLDGTKRFTVLKQAVAVAAGLLWGPDWITETYENVRLKLYDDLTPEQCARAMKILDRILTTYERAAQTTPAESQVLKDKQIQNAQWKVGNFTGYMIYSYWTYPEAQWDWVSGCWVKFLSEYRQEPAVLNERLLNKRAQSRAMSHERWKAGAEEILGAAAVSNH